ncbi:Imm47 family immunity protein [Paenibacillus ehimensis]|uniref:Imm47 family immunity protein n=1 Tax=Paenibacillus ehimensis TaxID=79264 RepID=UPI002676A85D|nr:Imm47 family immunity protein [Paenibacillus ehimensis]
MEILDRLIGDIWYSDKNDGMANEIKECIRLGDTESVVLLELINAFKQGDFSQKTKLLDLIHTNENRDLLNVAIRLFFSVATPDDFAKIDNFLIKAEQEIVPVFVSFAEESLSYQIIPSLLGLLSIWEDTELGEDISYKIGSMIGYDKATYELCSVDELGNEFITFCKDKDLEKYYYDGELAFPGHLTKMLIEETMIARSSNSELKNDTIPSLLSIWSGIKCPADYYTKVDDKIAGQILEYVKQIASMKWEKGCKYFYGHKIH